MTAELKDEVTYVPIADGEEVEVHPGQPWPSAYRGSRYSVIQSRRDDRDDVLEWQYHDLRAQVTTPAELLSAMRSVGKSSGSGLGSLRITADREVLTKVHSDDYPDVHEAAISEGWIPVYLGRLSGHLGFTEININPEPLNGEKIAVWEGFPFNHGERWSVGVGGKLIWKWLDYRFESAHDHSGLVSRYRSLRNPAGRLYINEYGRVYVNVSPDDVPEATKEDVLNTYERWRTTADRAGNSAAKRLVNRRLQATSPSDDPKDGLLPMYIGTLDDFDDGVIPKPVVEDVGYYRACGRQEISDGY